MKTFIRSYQDKIQKSLTTCDRCGQPDSVHLSPHYRCPEQRDTSKDLKYTERDMYKAFRSGYSYGFGKTSRSIKEYTKAFKEWIKENL